MTPRAAADDLPVGIVEGFYGTPWSHQDRLDIIRFMGAHGMNLYIYAPKDDPHHRESWREPYSDEEMAQFRELVRTCQASGVDFCFAVSPGKDMVYSDPHEQELLLNKMMSLHPDGVTHFALFLDDIDVKRMGEADRARFHSAVEAQMYLANALGRQILEREPHAWLLLCPTVYLGVKPNDYWDTLRESLDPCWRVVWTGIDVVAPTITPEQLDAITANLGRPPFIWDNYPVNDYAANVLRLGPIEGRTPELPARISGYASNPMNQAHASMIALATIADFFRDPGGYNPEASWRAAIREVGGPAAGDLQILAEQCRSSQLDPAESRDLLPLIDVYLANPSEANSAALHRGISEVVAAADRLSGELPSTLSHEVSPWVESLGERARAMGMALDFIEGRLAPGSVPALKRLMTHVRESKHTLASQPMERLFLAAVGRRPTDPSDISWVHPIDAVDPPREGEYPGSRGEDQLIIYTPAYGHPSTGTNPWGAEAIVRDGVVVRVGDGEKGNDSPIPENGFVVSGHGTSRDWIMRNLQPGVPVTFDQENVRFSEMPEERMNAEQRITSLRVHALGALAEMVDRSVPREDLNRVRGVLQAIDTATRRGEAGNAAVMSALRTRVRAVEAAAGAGSP
jgi:hyaluronoglucosaminidase